VKHSPRIVVGAGVLIHRRGKLLLVKRAEQPDKGAWSFPGGAVELGETTEETAVREVKEETGLDIELEGVFDVKTYLARGFGGSHRNQIVVVDYLGKPLSGRVRLNSESSDFGWYWPNEVRRLRTTRNIKQCAAKFARMNVG
jgi:8-oxo-dGTP diphosphatase